MKNQNFPIGFCGETHGRDRLLGRQQPAHPPRTAPHAADADLPRAAGGALRSAVADARAAPAEGTWMGDVR